jgi:hypothetical protein
MIFTD